ncbi:glycosyltransferase family 2 protein [Paenibacillus sp. JDR-2]|uniref:glycosyltransferase family 2 protein n=1 Tax=Paenibacillus sp. (strain JDR-2) TaxID=324057 RepID=UPI0001667D9C|nr:glycosyltransferase [Paenibacillus sp. JDR-2]ACT04480.1 glycosyl transferase family 2 [Paenibacillus sp. JDR-2]
MLLGVHIIVRNEEDMLPECLDSIRGIADELIVVDTGSTDGTVDIALRYGARVIKAEWKDNFSSARNLALEHARTIWVLVLDADERLKGDSQSLRQGLRKAASPAYRLRMEHLLDGSNTGRSMTSEAVRLFRADRGYVYHGEIHEQLVRVRETEDGAVLKDVDGPLCAGDSHIAHIGYMPDVLQRKSKAERNLRVISRQLTKRPNDPFCLYNYGVTLCQLGKAEEAAVAFDKALGYTPLSAPYRPTLVRDYATTLLALSRNGEAAELLRGETLRYPDYPDLYLLQGNSLSAAGMLLEAKAAYEAAIEAGSRPHSYISENGAGSYQAQLRLASVLQRTGEAEAALLAYEALLGAKPGWEEALLALADYLQQLGVPDQEIRQKLSSFTGNDVADPHKLMARVLSRIGANSMALPLWREVVQSTSVSTAGAPMPEQLPWCDIRGFADCLIGTGQYAEAASQIRSWLQAAQPSADAEPSYEILQLGMDWALCRWNDGLQISREELAAVLGGGRLAHEAEHLNGWLPAAQGPQNKIAKEQELAAAARWLDTAVSRGMLRLAHRLAGGFYGLRPYFETLLYDHGYVDAAAEQMLDRFEKEGRLTGEQSFRLGELLYLKKLHNEALSLFDSSAESDKSGVYAERARLGAAAACLQLAIEALQPDEYSGTRNWDGSWSEPDRMKLQEALLRVEWMSWQTSWNGRQRRRVNGGTAEADFLMYDR